MGTSASGWAVTLPKLRLCILSQSLTLRGHFGPESAIPRRFDPSRVDFARILTIRRGFSHSEGSFPAGALSPRIRSWDTVSALRQHSGLGLDPNSRVLFGSLFLWEIGYGLYAYFLTVHMMNLGATGAQIGLLLSIQGLIRILVFLPAGMLSDHFSRRTIIIATTAITVPATLSFAIAQDWWQLLPGLALLVLGNLGTPAFSSYISESSRGGNQARTFAMVYTVGPSIAMVIAPLAGGVVADTSSLRLVFVLSALFGLFSAVALTRLTELPPAPAMEVRATYRAALSLPVVRAVALLQFAILGVLAIGTTLLPNYLTEAYGLSLREIGVLGSIGAIGGVALSLGVGRIQWMTALRTIALAVLGIGFLCLVVQLSGNPAVLAIAFLGRGGLMVAWALFAAVLAETVPSALQPRAFASAELLGAIGFGFAPLLAGALFDWRIAAPLTVTWLLAPLLAYAALRVEDRFQPSATPRPGDTAHESRRHDVVRTTRKETHDSARRSVRQSVRDRFHRRFGSERGNPIGTRHHPRRVLAGGTRSTSAPGRSVPDCH